MAKHYSEKYISENLDGFGKNGSVRLEDCLNSSDTIWQPVVQATIYSVIDNERHVLTGIRKPLANMVHPNVVSTPTSLFPKEYAAALYKSLFQYDELKRSIHLETIQVDKLQILSRFTENPHINIPTTDNMLSYSVANILARKLGISQSLEYATLNNPIGKCWLSTISAGFCYAADSILNGEPLFEPLLMFGVVVELKSHDLIPSHSESYDNISWSLLGDYKKGVETKRLEYFNKRKKECEFDLITNEVTVCVRGLCLQTAIITIDAYNVLEVKGLFEE